MVSEIAVVEQGEGEALWFFGMLILVKASAETTGGAFCLTEQLGRRGIATPMHSQTADQETFIMLDGELRFYLEGGDAITVGPGATVYVPAGMPHAFEIVSESARFLNLTTPNHEAFFRAVSEPAPARELPPAGPPDMPKVMAAAARFGVEILGPPPAAH